ncbi:protease [marine bacterium AO1-C]|nr:protease [marine bacterium AO1-C]
MMRKIIPLICLLLLPGLLWSQGTQLLRQPTISSSHVVFVYANDLWKASRNGGEAIRLTSHEGYESRPHFSPDEQWIAFSGQYDGNTDVYVIPAQGGIPKRLTWHPSADEVQGWTPDGQVIFRSTREARPTRLNAFYKVKATGGMPTKIKVPRGAYGEMSPDGQYMAYVPITSWDAEWRNYRGGQAMPIWILNLNSQELIRTPQGTKERHLDPVWYKKKVYYLSERDYASNIWSFDPQTKTEQQITRHAQFDVKSLDAGKDAIVYEQGGYLHILNPASGESKQLNIQVNADLNYSRTRWENVTARRLTNPNLSPNGKRAIFEYRGEIFTFPKKEGSWRNLSNSSGAADRYPIWSPKGDKVAWFSDKSGEYQLVISDQMGKQQKSIKLPNPTFYFRPDWSPDGKYIAYTDTDYNIWSVDLASGKAKKVDTDRYAHPNRTMNPLWSPDSQWLCYARLLESNFKAVFAYNIKTGEKIQLTDGMADAIDPVWDASGKYLYFLASTNYGLQTGWLDMSSYDPSVTRSLYCLVLNKKDKSPTLAKSDEEAKKAAGQKGGKKAGAGKKGSMNIQIDKDGLARRIVPLRLPARNYVALLSGPKGSVFIMESVPNQRGLTMHKYNVKKMKPSIYSKGVRGAVVSSNRKHVMIRRGNSWVIANTAAKPRKTTPPLRINAKMKVNPAEEYAQIFKEGWRYMRDFLYVDNVHGAPWKKVYSWYAPWIKHVRHRQDLNYVVDILSGEVAIGHSYVSGGNMPRVNFVPVGLLGCDLVLDNGYYKIAKIYNGESWNPNLQAPLATPGLGVKEGDYLMAVNGQALKAPMNPYQLFEQTAGRTIQISIASDPKQAVKTVNVVPTRSEYGLRTADWIEGNRRKVDKLSNGKLAYVYIPNTGGGGFTSFNRYYFAQQHKKGVILDERNNGGGSAADYMIDVMARTVFGYFNSKANDNRPWTTPIAGIWGPKVMLINERAGSGGDLLPYMFKAKKLGPLVGTRTWGGLVGTWDTPRFVDGGRMVAPRGGFFDADGKWAVEGEGVAPDVEVIQDPKLLLQGRDPQLERGVKVALELLKKQEFKAKPEPPAPIRWKRPKGFKAKTNK